MALAGEAHYMYREDMKILARLKHHLANLKVELKEMETNNKDRNTIALERFNGLIPAFTQEIHKLNEKPNLFQDHLKKFEEIVGVFNAAIQDFVKSRKENP